MFDYTSLIISFRLLFKMLYSSCCALLLSVRIAKGGKGAFRNLSTICRGGIKLGANETLREVEFASLLCRTKGILLDGVVTYYSTVAPKRKESFAYARSAASNVTRRNLDWHDG